MKVLEGPAKASPEETRGRILAAAREIFALKGTRGTTTREVADRAGVNEATVFRHFGTKHSLLHEMIDQYCGSQGAIRGVLANLDGPLHSQLRALGLAGVEAIKGKEDLIRVGIAEQVTDPDGSAMTWRGPNDALVLLSDFMRRRIEAGELQGDPEMLARIFMSFWFAYVIGNKIWDDGHAESPEVRDRVVSGCVDLFLNGARAR
jgi:AcrR family transcriptional regulator